MIVVVSYVFPNLLTGEGDICNDTVHISVAVCLVSAKVMRHVLLYFCSIIQTPIWNDIPCCVPDMWDILGSPGFLQAQTGPAQDEKLIGYV